MVIIPAMTNALRWLLWTVVAWPLPALVAGAAGWRGVWGGTSALGDYLIPVPVAGGMLHVPSFIVCALVVVHMPGLSLVGAARLRALLIGLALAGLTLLLKSDRIALALWAGSGMPVNIWDKNPLGLFLFSDAVLALLFTLAAPQRPRLLPELASLALVLLPPVALLAVVLQHSHVGAPFLPGAGRAGVVRGDDMRIVFTSLDVEAADFRNRALDYAQRVHPRQSVNSDDVAVLFTPDLEQARRFDTTRVALTLCLYEDGTPPRWLRGSAAASCFDDHASFTEKFAAAYQARVDVQPRELRHYLARKDVCAGVARASDGTGGQGDALSHVSICATLERTRDELRARFPGAPGLD